MVRPYTHAEWIEHSANRYQTEGRAYPGDIRETFSAPGFDVDSIDAPEILPAGGMACRTSANLWWLRYGWPMTASRS